MIQIFVSFIQMSLPSIREIDLDLDESVFAGSSFDWPEAGARDDEPFGSWIVFNFGFAVKLRRLSERRLYFEIALDTLILGVVVDPGVVTELEEGRPNPANLNEFSVVSLDCWGELKRWWMKNYLHCMNSDTLYAFRFEYN